VAEHAYHRAGEISTLAPGKKDPIGNHSTRGCLFTLEKDYANTEKGRPPPLKWRAPPREDAYKKKRKMGLIRVE